MKAPDILLKDSVPSLFFHYFITSAAGMVMFSFYVLADTMFIGRFMGSEGLAALNVALPVFNLLFGTGLLLGVGGASAMSISLGRNEPHQIPAIFSTAVFSAIVIVSLYTFMGIVYMDELIHFLGGSQVNTALVKRYLQPIVVCNFTFVFVYMLTPFEGSLYCYCVGFLDQFSDLRLACFLEK